MSGFVDGACASSRCNRPLSFKGAGLPTPGSGAMTDNGSQKTWPPVASAAGGWDDENEEPPVKALSPDEAAALKSALPMLSPWRVLGMQLVAGLLCVAVIWLWTASGVAMASALYGVATV